MCDRCVIQRFLMAMCNQHILSTFKGSTSQRKDIQEHENSTSKPCRMWAYLTLLKMPCWNQGMKRITWTAESCYQIIVSPIPNRITKVRQESWEIASHIIMPHILKLCPSIMNTGFLQIFHENTTLSKNFLNPTAHIPGTPPNDTVISVFWVGLQYFARCLL